MDTHLENWRTQIRKGYLELCLLTLINSRGRAYGFEILTVLGELGLPLKEGTLYPLMSRMAVEGVLAAHWETENIKGHPRKFYSLTPKGRQILDGMHVEFEHMNQSLIAITNSTTTKPKETSDA